MRVFAAVLVSTSLVPLLAHGAGTDPPASLTGAAVQAVDQEKYCDALSLFLAMNARWPSARALYNAAEVAYAAGDRWRAVELYRDAQRLYPDYEKKGVLQQRVDEIGKRIAKEGPGNACSEKKNQCGDWRLEGNDTCDDGNLENDDGCDVLWPKGSPFTQPGAPKPTSGDGAVCVISACGNGVRIEGKEACDDGNLVDGDGCDKNCTETGCGNGVKTPGEECDDGNRVDGDGCDGNCAATACGNGVKTAGEQCDDGNQKDGDGCDEGCLFSRCGNGVQTRGEQCDDGNETDGDGCESNCTVTEVRAPIPGIILASAGVLAVGGSIGLFWAAGYQYAAHEAAVDEIERLESAYAKDPNANIGTVDEAHAQEAETRTAWEGWGRAAIGGGVILGAAGVGAIGGGVWWALTRTVRYQPDEATPTNAESAVAR